MVYAFKILIPFNTIARRDGAISELQSQITSRPRWGVESIESTVSKDGSPAVFADLRFVSEGDNDAVEQWLRNRLTGPRTPNDGAWIQIHRCQHDEEARSFCNILRQFDVIAGSWQRTI